MNIASGYGQLRRHHRPGTSIIETGLVLFFILLPLTFGAMEYGYAFFVKNSMQAAVREATRRSILPSCTTKADAEAKAKQVLANAFDKPGKILSTQFTFNWDGTNPGSASGTEIRLEITSPPWQDFDVRPLGNAPLWSSVAPGATRTYKVNAVMYKE